MKNIMYVRDLIDSYTFVSDSQDVKVIQDYINDYEFDSFFVLVIDGEYIKIYGIYGIVPYLDKRAYELL